jgi:hypothetical protein
MTVDGMRVALMERYSGEIRHQRVDRMPDSQVIAIYRRLEAYGELRKRPGIPKKQRLHPPERFEQMRMDIP